MSGALPLTGIYDWNQSGCASITTPEHPVELNDETLRDGMQAAYVTRPSMDEQVQLLQLMAELGIHTANIGLPGAGGTVYSETLALAQEVSRLRIDIDLNCAGRTLVNDARAIAELSQACGQQVEACLFVGSSPIRMDVQGWNLDRLLGFVRESITFATDEGLPVMFVTEDTTRAAPEDLRALYLTAIECGAARLCLSDTVGHATPPGVHNLVSFIRSVIDESGVKGLKIDWHGHMDRGLGVWNAVAAYQAGANRLHGAALGIGERVGNVPMDQLLINLKLLGYINQDLTSLATYADLASVSTHVPIPPNYPVLGSGAFETGTGVHADAIIKALRRGDRDLADRVYSAVPASWVGREQVICVGHMSGKSNVIWWLEERGIEPTDTLVDTILTAAKAGNRLLTNQEIEEIISAQTT